MSFRSKHGTGNAIFVACRRLIDNASPHMMGASCFRRFFGLKLSKVDALPRFGIPRHVAFSTESLLSGTMATQHRRASKNPGFRNYLLCFYLFLDASFELHHRGCVNMVWCRLMIRWF